MSRQAIAISGSWMVVAAVAVLLVFGSWASETGSPRRSTRRSRTTTAHGATPHAAPVRPHRKRSRRPPARDRRPRDCRASSTRSSRSQPIAGDLLDGGRLSRAAGRPRPIRLEALDRRTAATRGASRACLARDRARPHGERIAPGRASEEDGRDRGRSSLDDCPGQGGRSGHGRRDRQKKAAQAEAEADQVSAPNATFLDGQATIRALCRDLVVTADLAVSVARAQGGTSRSD